MKTKLSILGLAFMLSLSIDSVLSYAADPNEEVAANLKRLLETKECRECNLAGVNLNREDLSGADLFGADLTGAKLYLCNLSGANLQNSILKGAGLGGADLSGADLRGANLADTSLGGAYTQGAIIEETPEEQDSLEEDLEALLDKAREAGAENVERVQIQEPQTPNTIYNSVPGFVAAGGADLRNATKVKGDGGLAPLVQTIEPVPPSKKITPIKSVEVE